VTWTLPDSGWKIPTAPPTRSPTLPPTALPTMSPTDVPSPSPTEVPTEEPTAVPTPTPTEVPTTLPPTTDEPTFSPTPSPTEVPTPSPTHAPTEVPTPSPTGTPTEFPTRSPTYNPSAAAVLGSPEGFTCNSKKRFVPGAAYGQWSSHTNQGGEAGRALCRAHFNNGASAPNGWWYQYYSNGHFNCAKFNSAVTVPESQWENTHGRPEEVCVPTGPQYTFGNRASYCVTSNGGNSEPRYYQLAMGKSMTDCAALVKANGYKYMNFWSSDGRCRGLHSCPYEKLSPNGYDGYCKTYTIG